MNDDRTEIEFELDQETVGLLERRAVDENKTLDQVVEDILRLAIEMLD